MSTTLHNKIHLGRSSRLASRRVKKALALGALGTLAGLGLVLAALGVMQ